MLTIPNIKKATNLDLARITLDCLKELTRRGNRELNEAKQKVALFHSDILHLQSMIEELENNDDPNWDEEMEHNR